MAVQIASLTLALGYPLVYTYEIPLESLAATDLFFSPPPPMAPAVVQQRAPLRFEETLTQPAAIPDKVALVEDPPDAPARVLQASSSGMAGGVPGGFADPTLGFAAMPHIPAPPQRRIAVGGRIQAARLLNRVTPVYPIEARKENIMGLVVLHAIVAKDGKIQNVELVSGHPMLAPAAIEAVRQWRYKPTRLNGIEVEVATSIEVKFALVAPPEEEGKKKKKRRR